MASMDALLRIQAQVRGQNNIVSLQRALQGTEVAANNAGTALRGMTASLGPILGIVGGGSIAAKIFGDAATLETQTRSLQVLTGSARQAAQVVRELQQYGNSTPFEATDLIDTAKKLTAFGVESGRVVSVIKTLGDVAGATGANINELALAYGQVIAKGRLQGEELLQFQERGVALQEVLKKAYGLTGAEFQKALEGGRISAEAMEYAMLRLTEVGGKYANGAIAQSDTLNGRLSTLRDSVTALSQSIGTILAPMIKSVLSVTTDALNQINALINAARLGPQNAATIADVQAGKLPFGTAGVDRLIGEQRRQALQRQAGPGFLGFGFNTEQFLQLLQQQPEFRRSAAAGAAPRMLPALTPPALSAAAGTGGAGRGQASRFQLSSQGQALVNAAKTLGVDPLDLATIIGFETGGSYSPSIRGGAGNNYMGLIQFGGPERRQYGAHAGQSFEEQVQGPVVRFFQDRFRRAGMSTQGADLLTLYRTVLGGNPRASLSAADAFGTSPASGVARMAPHRAEALRRFFGGAVGNVGYSAADAGADVQKGYEEQQKAAEQAAKQLAAARDLLATREAQLRVAQAINPLDKAAAEFDRDRAERMRDYASKFAEARTDQERSTLVQAQLADIAMAEVTQRTRITEINAEQLQQEQERRDLLMESMRYMEELSTRGSAAAGFTQGISAYSDSVGNLRDGVADLSQRAMGGLEDSIVSLATTGRANFREFAASVLLDVTRLIVRQLVLKTIMQAIGAISGGGGGFEMPIEAFRPQPGGFPVTFATGGIVTRPTLFPFASGGAMRTGLMGEAGPEAILPLRRDATGRLGVAASGGSGVSVTINVDASGTKAAGDQGAAGALGRDLARVVDERLAYHRLPGGMLSAA